MIESLYDCFKHWSAKGSVYIFSDPHFDDEDVKLMNPHWVDPEQQVQRLKVACKNDTLIILGDVGNPEYFKRIKAHKVLILGNHDRGKAAYVPYFDEIYEGPLMIGPKIMLSHEPCPAPYWLNIHGHVHGGLFYDEQGNINVAADVCCYAPVSLGDIAKSGYLPKDDIHRMAIDKQVARAKK